jgi:hypothetical protein
MTLYDSFGLNACLFAHLGTVLCLRLVLGVSCNILGFLTRPVATVLHGTFAHPNGRFPMSLELSTATDCLSYTGTQGSSFSNFQIRGKVSSRICIFGQLILLLEECHRCDWKSMYNC